LLKRISIRLRWAMEDLTKKGIGLQPGKAEQVDEARITGEGLDRAG
jgi:hypothetical protein